MRCSVLVAVTVALVTGCAASRTEGDAGPDATTDLGADATDVDADATDVDACLPRPVGHDCMPYWPPPDGACPSYSCNGLRRDGGYLGGCPIGGACTTAADCPCPTQVCTRGVCWF